MAEDNGFRTDPEFLEAMEELTSFPQWETLVQELCKEVYHLQANAFEYAEDWGQLRETRGFCRGVATIINLRDTIETLKSDQHEFPGI